MINPDRKIETQIPAAGPWRYDVENAPKDGRDVMVQIPNRKGKRVWIGVMHRRGDLFLDDDGGFVNIKNVIAFAEINLPEDKA